MVVAFAAYLLAYSAIHGYRFSNLYALALLAVCIQLVLLFFIRAVFVNIFDVVGFKRCLLLLGEGPLAPRLKLGWRRTSLDILMSSTMTRLKPDKVVPLRRAVRAALAAPELLHQ